MIRYLTLAVLISGCIELPADDCVTASDCPTVARCVSGVCVPKDVGVHIGLFDDLNTPDAGADQGALFTPDSTLRYDSAPETDSFEPDMGPEDEGVSADTPDVPTVSRDAAPRQEDGSLAAECGSGTWGVAQSQAVDVEMAPFSPPVHGQAILDLEVPACPDWAIAFTLSAPDAGSIGGSTIQFTVGGHTRGVAIPRTPVCDNPDFGGCTPSAIVPGGAVPFDWPGTYRSAERHTFGFIIGGGFASGFHHPLGGDPEPQADLRQPIPDPTVGDRIPVTFELGLTGMVLHDFVILVK